jgi:hypothetical protein
MEFKRKMSILECLNIHFFKLLSTYKRIDIKDYCIIFNLVVFKLNLILHYF